MSSVKPNIEPETVSGIVSKSCDEVFLVQSDLVWFHDNWTSMPPRQAKFAIYGIRQELWKQYQALEKVENALQAYEES